MGKLVNGEWVEAPERGHDDQGFDDWIDSGDDGTDPVFPAAPERYHLYISRACPLALRTALTRRILGLEDVLSIDIVDPVRRDDGWEFSPENDGCTGDSVNGFPYIREVYTQADPNYTGRVTVPVLYDTDTRTIVNNESDDIERMIVRAFGEYATRDVDLYPEYRRDEIDSIIDSVHRDVNLGVYRAGFADSQAEYEWADHDLFDALDNWNDVLGERRYLVGNQLTLADVFLFPTLYRFDAVYYTHFKCNVKRLVDYEHLWGYAREIYQNPGVRPTCNMDHVKDHYRSHGDINPTRIVPVGPGVDWSAPHSRATLERSVQTPMASGD